MNNNQIEYTVTKKSEGSYKIKRMLMMLLYIAYSLAFIIIVSQIHPGIIAVLPITLVVLILLTWKYVNIEYKYEIRGSKLVFSEIIGGRKEKEKATFDLTKSTAVIPVEKSEEISKIKVEKVYEARPSVLSKECFVLFADDQNGTSSAFYFQSPERVLKSVKYYLPVDVRADLDDFLDEE